MASVEKSLPPGVMAGVRAESMNLYHRRLLIDRQLLCIILTAGPRSSSNPRGVPTVSYNAENDKWMVVNLFRDWVGNQIGQIDNQGDSNARADRGSARGLTVARFYRTLSRMGGEDLTIESLFPTGMDKAYFKSESQVRVVLTELKRKATELEEPLAQSTLQYPERDMLDYLTCVNVKDDYVSWTRQGKSESDDEVR